MSVPLVAMHDGGTLSGKERISLLALRLGTLVVLVVLLTLHVRSLRVYRWEQSFSGGVLVTYCVAVLGLALCSGTEKCGGHALQTYLTGTGAILLAVNATVIGWRWRASDMTRVVADLLIALGVPIRRQIMLKVILSAMAAVALLVDLGITIFLKYSKR